MIMKIKHKSIKYVILAIISAISTIILELPIFFSRYFVEFDSLRYAMPVFNNNSYLPGPRILYSLFLNMPKEIVIAVVPFVLLFITCIFSFKIGSKLKDDKFGFLVASVTSFFIISTEWIAGFNPRGFAFPILAAFIYFLLLESAGYMALCIVLGALFYPILFPIMAGAALLQCFIRRLDKKKVLQIIAAILFCAVFLLFFHRSYAYPNIEFYSYDEIMSMQEFEAGGGYGLHDIMSHDIRFLLSFDFIRTQLLGRNVYEEVNYKLFCLTTAPLFAAIILLLIMRKKSVKLGMSLGLLILASAALNMWLGTMRVTDSTAWAFLLFTMTYFIYPRKNKIPGEIYWILLISLLCSLAVYALYPFLSLKLYVADRFLKTTVFLVLPIFAAFVIKYMLVNKRIKFIMAAFAIILLVFVAFDYHSRLYECKYPEIYKTLSGLPDGLVAGQPRQMNCVPFFTGKTVLISQIESMVELKGLWPTQKEITYRVFDALYSDDYKEILDFCKEFNVNYFVLDEFFFSDLYLSYWFLYDISVFDDFIIEQGTGKDYGSLVQSVPKEMLIPVREGQVIVDCSS
jgi:hypothetical protein